MWEGLVDVWKENILENLELEEVEFELVREFLLKLKNKFGKENKKSVKVAELKKVEQEERTIKEFV